jgi:dTDP-4-dehydrorhamnose reductase
MLESVQPDFIINLVALTNVDQCEAHPNSAYQLNVKTTENLVYWLQHNPSSKLIHISTDQVYDGRALQSEHEVSITNTYALSKYAAELSACSVSACILRTNFFGKSELRGRKSLSDWVLSSLMEKKHIKGFTDIFFSPLLIQTLSEMIALVVGDFRSGVYNLGSRGGVSKADFAFLLAAAFDLDTTFLERATSVSSGLKTYRPKDMRMNVSLFEQTYGVQLPTLPVEVTRLRATYEN